jgi:non-ribosomal peptide synthetase component F
MPSGLWDQVRRVGATEMVTPFMIGLAAFQTLLARQSGQDDICVGMGIMQRDHQQIQKLIGSFMNVLLMRTDLSGGPTFRALLRRTSETVLGALAHQEMPFTEVVDDLTRAGVSALPTRVIFDFLRGGGETVHVGSLSAVPIDPDTPDRMTGSELSLRMEEFDTSALVTVFYRTDLFDAATIQRLLDSYEALLRELVDDLDATALPAAPLRKTA